MDGERDADVVTRGSAGERFRRALDEEKPLQIVGTPNALVALMAERTGYRAIYLSGAGVANLSYGLPDLAVTTLDNVLEDARRITGASGLPLLVDVDTGFGAELMIGRTVREMIRAGVAAVHMEDQVADKRCGHRPRKALVSRQEMVDRIQAAVDARTDPGFVVMARTDAVAVEGMDRALERAEAYARAGADMIFPEALTDLEQYRAFKAATGRPVLANLTEFGLTPAFTTSELASAGVDMALYPLSASRAMNRAALRVLAAIRDQGTQSGMVAEMQTRKELYELLGYEELERKQDKKMAEDSKKMAEDSKKMAEDSKKMAEDTNG